MAQRGRKTAESLSAVTIIPGQRPPPPPELTKEQAEAWKAIVAQKPVEWFDTAAQFLLIELCRHTAICGIVSQQLDSFPVDQISTEEGCDRYDKLGRMLDRHSKAVAMLATKLRLAPQSRYEPSVARSRHNNATAGSGAARPWETAA